MKSNRWLHVVGATVLALVVCVGGWWLLSDRDEPSSDGSPESSQSPSVPLAQQEIDEKRFTALRKTVNRFIKTYHYRDASLTSDMLRKQLAPLVTETFLDANLPSLSTESDKWVRESDGVIMASAAIIPGDAGVDSTNVNVTVDVTVTGEAGGMKEQPYTFRVVLSLVWQSDTWRVDAFE